jgi:hypothetical protein
VEPFFRQPVLRTNIRLYIIEENIPLGLE